MPIYKTVIRVEVLSDGPYEWDTLNDVYRDSLVGGVSEISETESSVRLTTEEATAECDKHHTGPEFFGIETGGKNGNSNSGREQHQDPD